MSNTQQIETSLKSLILDDDREFVAMLSGEWGIGKTYFWNKFKDKYLKDKDVVYISLFGQNSLQDIETSIVMKLSKYAKGTQKYKKHLDKIGELGSKALNLPFNVSMGSILSLFSPSDFKNIIICFDDFERLSDKVSLKDVMGLISQFKEQKECKIIMILNEQELNKLSDIEGKRHDEIFSLYKEKIVDYNFHYMPSQEELFEAIKADIEKIEFCDHQYIYNFFKKIDLKNIRIMKQTLYQLEHFSFIKEYELDDKVVKEFVEITLNLFVFKAKSNYTYVGFLEMEEYKSEKSLQSVSEDKSFNLNAKHDKNSDYYLENDDYFSTEYKSTNKDIIEKYIYDFIDNHTINEKELHSLLEENNQSLSWYDVRNEISEVHKRLYTDFSTKHSELVNQLLTLLKNSKDDMHRLFFYNKFKSFLEDINEFPPTESTESLEKEVIENYITFYSDNPTYDEKSYGGFYIDDIKSNYLWAKEFYDAHKKKALVIKNDDEIIDLIKAINANKHHESDVKAILALVPPEKFKELIERNHTFPEILVKFMISSTARHYMKDTIKNICEALVSLRDKSKEYNWKINQIIKSANINLEDYK